MKKYIVFILFLSIIQNMYGQPDTTIRLTIVSGSSVNFDFNSYDKINSFIEFQNWTRFRTLARIYDASIPGELPWTIDYYWRLSVYINNTPITGEAGNTMNLDKIYVEATYTGGSGTGVPVGGLVLVNGTDEASANLLMDGGPANVNEEYFNITYRVENMLGQAPDYYFPDLVFVFEVRNTP